MLTNCKSGATWLNSYQNSKIPNFDNNRCIKRCIKPIKSYKPEKICKTIFRKPGNTSKMLADFNKIYSIRFSISENSTVEVSSSFIQNWGILHFYSKILANIHYSIFYGPPSPRYFTLYAKVKLSSQLHSNDAWNKKTVSVEYKAFLKY